MFPGGRTQTRLETKPGGPPSRIGFKFHFINYLTFISSIIIMCFLLFFLSLLYIFVNIVGFKNIKYWYYSYLCFSRFFCFCIRNIFFFFQLGFFRFLDFSSLWLRLSVLCLRKLLPWNVPWKRVWMHVRSNEKGLLCFLDIRRFFVCVWDCMCEFMYIFDGASLLPL